MPEPTASLQPCIRQAGEHQRLAYTGGHELAVILDAAITGGQLTVIDTHARRGDASPVHVHSRDDEAFLLLDGQMTVWVGGGAPPTAARRDRILAPQYPARGPVRHRLPGTGAVHAGRLPGGSVPLRRLGPERAQARRLAAHPGLARQGRAAGRG